MQRTNNICWCSDLPVSGKRYHGDATSCLKKWSIVTGYVVQKVANLDDMIKTNKRQLIVMINTLLNPGMPSLISSPNKTSSF